MNVSNGKLLGQVKSDLDILKEKIEHRCDRLEASLSKEQQEQIQFYKNGLEKVYYLQQVLGQQIKNLENNRSSYLDKSLVSNKHLISRKVVVFSLSTSLIVSTMALLTSFKTNSQHQCQSALESTKTSIIHSKNES